MNRGIAPLASPEVFALTARNLPSDGLSEVVQPASYSIPPERMEEARARLAELQEFLRQLDVLDIGTTAPATTFDPSWEQL